jgi:fucose 4-O-acetylase-like acetyltransferase
MCKSSDQQKINIVGIQILRMLLSLWIVLVHCCNIRSIILKTLLQDKEFHVPIFLIISFYFFYDKIYLKSFNKIWIRFERLLIPYIFFPLIILILNNVFFVDININSPYRKLTYLHFIKQLIFGIGIHDIFWFQFFLIFLSVFFLIISLIFTKNFLLILKLILIVCYLLQYSGLIFEYFITFREKAYRCIGSIVEILPYAVTGLILASFNLINKIKGKKDIIFVNIIILFFIKKYDIIRCTRGFRYPGIALNIGGICLFICFSFITFNKHTKFLFIIKHITNYTGGVYYLHIVIMNIFKNKISFIGNKTMMGGFAIYIICYFICFIGVRIFGKTKLKYLFY